LAAERFDAFVTVDRNLSFQQKLRTLCIGVVVLVARSNRLVDLQPLMSRVAEAIPGLTPGRSLRKKDSHGALIGSAVVEVRRRRCR
jgi:hypothetical protein